MKVAEDAELVPDAGDLGPIGAVFGAEHLEDDGGGIGLIAGSGGCEIDVGDAPATEVPIDMVLPTLDDDHTADWVLLHPDTLPLKLN
ncbi:MAG: hypothetical protein EBT09_05260 [Actinobacteria bacterium]|nr:hypothetical protein [Actinomycetota bacterium]